MMDDELDGPGVAERWSLDLDTLSWIEAKAGPRRLGLATQLHPYALTGRFAESAEAIPPAAARHLAEQTGRLVGRQPPWLVPAASMAGLRTAAVEVGSAQGAPSWLSAGVVGAATASAWCRVAAVRRR